MLQAILGRQNPFVRTPKRGSSEGSFRGDPGTGYRLPFDWISLIEIAFALYAAWGVFVAGSQRNAGPFLFLISCFFGFSYVAVLSLAELVSD